VRLLIAGNEDVHLAHTLDVSSQLCGYRGEMKVGDEIVIQYCHARAQFRVTWIAAREGSSEKQIWGAEVPQETAWQQIAAFLGQAQTRCSP